MADDTARGVIHPAEDGIAKTVGYIQGRDQFFAHFGIHHLTFDAVELCGRYLHAKRFQGGFAMGQVQVSAVIEHQVKIELSGQHRP